jgi:hypothetical protein
VVDSVLAYRLIVFDRGIALALRDGFRTGGWLIRSGSTSPRFPRLPFEHALVAVRVVFVLVGSTRTLAHEPGTALDFRSRGGPMWVEGGFSNDPRMTAQRCRTGKACPCHGGCGCWYRLCGPFPQQQSPPPPWLQKCTCGTDQPLSFLRRTELDRARTHQVGASHPRVMHGQANLLGRRCPFVVGGSGREFRPRACRTWNPSCMPSSPWIPG